MLVFGSFADSKLLDFGQLTYRINRMLGVSRYDNIHIWYRPNSYTHARGLLRQGQGTYG